MRLAFLLSFVGSLFAGVCFPGQARAGMMVIQNDQLPDSGTVMVAQEGTFAKGEGVGVTFNGLSKYAPYQIVGVEFFIGGGGNATVTTGVYRESGQAAPGTKLGEMAAMVEGTTMFFQELDLPSPVSSSEDSLRVTAFTDTDTLPSGIQFLADPMTASDKRTTICAYLPKAPCTWQYATSLFIKHAWLIRLIISSDGILGTPDGGSPDGGKPDGGTGMGGAPQVDSITPATLPAGMGGAAVILGKNFANGNPGSTVTLDGPQGPTVISGVLVNDVGTIKIQIPAALPAGTYNVIVGNPNGQKGMLTAGLTISQGQASGCNAGTGAGTGAVGSLLLALLLVEGPRRLRRFAIHGPRHLAGLRRQRS